MSTVAGGDDEITVREAAKLLGMAVHSAYALIKRGELHAEVVQPSARPRQRRTFCLTRQDVADFIERARVKPGALRHLDPEWTWERYG